MTMAARNIHRRGFAAGGFFRKPNVDDFFYNVNMLRRYSGGCKYIGHHILSMNFHVNYAIQ